MTTVKATTTAVRNESQFKFLDDVRDMAAATKCRDPAPEEGAQEDGEPGTEGI